MSTPPEKPDKRYVPVTDVLDDALKDVVRALKRLARPEKWTQQDIVTGSWLWMATLDPQYLAREIAPHVRRAHEELAQFKTESPRAEKGDFADGSPPGEPSGRPRRRKGAS